MGDDLVKVAWARDRAEGELIRGLLESAGIACVLLREGVDGPQVGVGLLNPDGGSQRVLVHADRAEEASALLADTLVEGEMAGFPEPVNAEHLADAGGRRPRDYGLIGAYARAIVLSFGVFVVAFAIFLLFRSF